LSPGKISNIFIAWCWARGELKKIVRLFARKMKKRDDLKDSDVATTLGEVTMVCLSCVITHYSSCIGGITLLARYKLGVAQHHVAQT
jgi:hypothetical protein